MVEKIMETGKRMAVSEVNITTDIVADVSSIADAIINYAANNNIDNIINIELWVLKARQD